MRCRNEDYRYGSARWADEDDIARAGLFDGKGLPFGFYNNRLLRFDSDAPRIVFGGAGSGKLRDLLSYVLCLPNIMPMAILDPRGELWAISIYTLAAQGIYANNWNPFKQNGQPSHSINPLEHLKPNSPTLFAEIQRLVRALIQLSGSGSGKFFELTAQNVLSALILDDVNTNGWTSFPRLYERINMIEGDLDAWADVLENMQKSPDPYLRTAASAMMSRQLEDAKIFGSVMAEIYAYLVWLNDPMIRESLQGGDASLSEMVDGKRPVRFYFNVPGDLLEFCSPILRVFFDSIMALKSRRPQAKPILLLIDEAAMLGKFEALKTAFTFGRGAGIVTWAVFQDLGQLSVFGNSGVQTFLGSSALRIFMGTRENTTASVVSQMCGDETLEYENKVETANAHHQKLAQIEAILSGADPVQAVRAYAHFDEASQRRTKMHRKLITPSEVMGLREDEMIVFISGKDLPPIWCNKYPYYERPEMAGLYLPNPYHPPTDRIQMQGMFRRKWLKVREIQVPKKYAQFPQYQSGTALEIESYPL